MKFRINTQLNDPEGKPLSFPVEQTANELMEKLPIELRLKVLPFLDVKTKKPRLLKDICIDVILIPVETDDELAKMKKYELYKALFAAKEEIELPVEDVTVLKKAISKFQPQLMMGQCFELIENGGKSRSEEKTKTKKT